MTPVHLKRIVACVGLSLALSACTIQTASLGAAPTPDTLPDYEYADIFVFWGLGQNKVADVARFCNGVENVAAIQTGFGFWQGLVSGLTGGIVQPRGVRVYCKR